MDAVRNWFRHSSPVVKGLMAMSVTSALVVLHRLYYKPYVRKQRYLEAEMFADIIEMQAESKPADHDSF